MKEVYKDLTQEDFDEMDRAHRKCFEELLSDLQAEYKKRLGYSMKSLQNRKKLDEIEYIMFSVQRQLDNDMQFMG